MSFLVRQLSKTAEGKEIVRNFPHDKDSILVGRAAACEVHLQDLAVELEHARISYGSKSAIQIEAMGDRGFDLDGKSVKRAQIDPRKGAELRFGSHRLTIGTEEDQVVVASERIEALSDATEEKEEMGLFTLKGKLPGRRISAWGFLLLVLAAFLAWPIYSFTQNQFAKKRGDGFHPDTTWSSGPLSTAHQGLSDDCQACHVKPFEAVRDQQCVACHKDTHDHAPDNRMVNAKAEPDWQGRLLRDIAIKFNRPEGRCVECHTEHEGAGPMAATAQKFCSDCHTDLNTRLTDTKIGNAEDFGKLHPQFQPWVTTIPGDNPVRKRMSLDSNPTDNNGLKFPHDMHLSRTNGVAKMAQTLGQQFGFGDQLACKDCHTPTADGVRFQPMEMEQQCGMCHSLAVETIGDTVRTLRHGEPKQVIADLRAFYRSGGPFRPQMLGGQQRRRPGDYAQGARYYAYFGAVNYGRADNAIRAVFSEGGACYDCHTVTPPPSGSDNWQVMKVHQPMRYMTKGWFDHEAHKTEECSSCHKVGTSSKATDLLLPDLKSCRDCHGGEASNSDVPSSCAMCHSYHADDGAPWVPTKVKKRESRKFTSVGLYNRPQK